MQNPRGGLARLPAKLAAYAKALFKSLRTIAGKLADFLNKFRRCLWSSYVWFETHILEACANCLLVIYNLGGFLLFLIPLIVGFFLGWWLSAHRWISIALVCFTLVYLIILIVAFFSMGDIEVESEIESSNRAQAFLVQIMRFLLRGAFVIVVLILFAFFSVRWEGDVHRGIESVTELFNQKIQTPSTPPQTLEEATARTPLVVKIGHVGPLSGAIAHLGKDNENGARMAIDELNAKGVKIGGNAVKFELVTADDAGDPGHAIEAARKLVDAKVNGVVGHLNSSTTIPASTIYFDAGIPQISPSATNPKYTEQGYSTAFRLVVNDSQLGGSLGRYAISVSKAKRVAVIDDRTAYGQLVADAFINGVKAMHSDASVVAREYTTDNATDFTQILSSIQTTNPDLVFFGGMDAVAAPILRTMRQLDINAKFIGSDGICTEALAKLAGDAIADEQVVCAEAGGVEESGKQALERWKASFQNRFSQPMAIYAPFTYDAVMTLVDAMQKAGSVEPAKYLPVLAKIRHIGITGNIAFDKKGDLLKGTMTLYTYKGGRRELLSVTK